MMVLVVLHVSAAHNSTDFALELLNRRIFVFNDNTLELHILPDIPVETLNALIGAKRKAFGLSIIFTTS